MARSEARIFTEIWDDPDFLALSIGAQRLFLFLISQSDLAHDGVMPLRERRWASSANGLKLRQVLTDLAALVQARFVIVDDGTEELLIRSFIRRDGVCKQPNLIRAARAHLSLVRSMTIRAAVAEELRRLLEDAALDRTRELLAIMLADLTATGSEKGPPKVSPKGSAKGSGDPSPNGTANPSSGALGERGVVTAVTGDSPSPCAPSPAASQQPPGHSPTPDPAAAQRLLLDALADEGITADEADALVELVRRERKPRNLGGLLRTMARDGDLAELLAQLRDAAASDDAAAAIHDARQGPECDHGEPGGAFTHPVTGLPLCPLCRSRSAA